MKQYAYIGIAGALTMAIADIVLLGQPVSGSHFDLSGFGAMEYTDSRRAATGSLMGLVAAFFICFGYGYLRYYFRLAGTVAANWLFISLCSTMFFGGAFHAGYYFLVHPAIGPHIHPLIYQQYIGYLQTISYLGVPGFIAGSILFFKLSLHPAYPVWLRYANPLIVTVLVLAILYVIPAPVGGYIRPAFINLATAIVFVLSLKASHQHA